MSQVKVNEIYDASGGSAAKLYGSSMRYGGTAFVNRIINGDMRIDQRNAGASVNITGTSAYPVDRFYGFATQTGKLTMQRNAGSVTPPTGFTNYVGATVVSAATLTGGDEFALTQAIEGFNIADLAWGTASAATVTMSFWVRSSLTGTFSGALRNEGAARSYPFTYNISAANTWEYKTITVAGDISGTWLTNNGTGIILTFGLGAGASKKTTAGAWAAGNFIQATGSVDLAATAGATFYITGVQLEAGTVASPFERRDYGRELIMCQRYCQVLRRTQTGAVSDLIGIGVWSGNPNVDAMYTCVVTMRATPSVAFSGTAGFDFLRSALAWEPVTSWGTPEPTASAVRLNANVATGDTRGFAAELRNQGTNTITISAEL